MLQENENLSKVFMEVERASDAKAGFIHLIPPT